jgi:hypothetical protein
MIPCGLKGRPSKELSRVGDGDKMGWPMTFQHANNITHVEAPSSTTVRKIFRVNFSWCKPLLSETQHGMGDEVLSRSYQA